MSIYKQVTHTPLGLSILYLPIPHVIFLCASSASCHHHTPGRHITREATVVMPQLHDSNSMITASLSRDVYHHSSPSSHANTSTLVFSFWYETIPPIFHSLQNQQKFYCIPSLENIFCFFSLLFLQKLKELTLFGQDFLPDQTLTIFKIIITR